MRQMSSASPSAGTVTFHLTLGGWPFAVGLQFIGRAPVTWVVTDHIHGDSLILGVA